MEKKYHFFHMGSILFDENRTVAELVEAIFNQEDYYEPAGMDLVTVYDTSAYRIILDRTHSCKEENLGENLCAAYYKPGVFYYAEGGWGHHMIQMNAVAQIPNPVSFPLRFEDFGGTPVFTGEMQIGHLVNSLQTTGYLSPQCHTVKIYDNHVDCPQPKKLELVLDMHSAGDAARTLFQITKSVDYLGLMVIE